MKLLILLALAQTPNTLDYVRDLQPDLSEGRSVQVSAAIDAAAEKHGQDPLLLAAIARTESNFRSGLRACWIVHRYQSCQVTCDYGLAQVNQLWIRKWNLDARRLQYDDRYNLMVAARILKALEREYAEAEPENWYGRYHSGTPSKRAAYEANLEPLLVLR